MTEEQFSTQEEFLEKYPEYSTELRSDIAINLKNCPHCNSKPKITRTQGACYKIICEGCKMQTHAKCSIEVATEIWNRRYVDYEIGYDPKEVPCNCNCKMHYEAEIKMLKKTISGLMESKSK